MATEVCRTETPRLEGDADHRYACHHPAVTVTGRGAGPMSATVPAQTRSSSCATCTWCTAPVGGGLFSRERVYALTGADLTVRAGETIGVVGESGCGKSTMAKVLVGLQRPTSGTVAFAGKDVWSMNAPERRQHIGAGVGMIFQDPATSLNRRMPVRDILRDPLDVHRRGTRKRARGARKRADGPGRAAPVGRRRRCRASSPAGNGSGCPSRVPWPWSRALVIADEPTSALDVSVRAQILNLLLDLRSG